MNGKPILTGLTLALIVFREVAPHKQNYTLVEHPHYDREMHTDSVASTAAPVSASGGQVAFDNEAFSPSLPWARWWRADESRMVAVQGMMRLGV